MQDTFFISGVHIDGDQQYYSMNQSEIEIATGDYKAALVVHLREEIRSSIYRGDL